ncbi:CT398-like coiled coil hairpin domain-containing protein, partial [Corynebacterium propinquum]
MMKLAPKQQQRLLELANLERAQASAANSGVGSAAGGGAATGAGAGSGAVNKSVTPERAEADKAAATLKRARDAAAAAQMAVDDMEAEILRIQQDERKLKRRNIDNKKQLATEQDPEIRKDLEHDKYTTKSRIADLMSELQEAHNEIHALRQNRDVHAAKVDQAKSELEAAERAADAADAVKTEEPDPVENITKLRAELQEQAPEALAAYDDVRGENGVGVARFTGRGCGGCYIQLPPADQSAVRG